MSTGSEKKWHWFTYAEQIKKHECSGHVWGPRDSRKPVDAILQRVNVYILYLVSQFISCSSPTVHFSGAFENAGLGIQHQSFCRSLVRLMFLCLLYFQESLSERLMKILIFDLCLHKNRHSADLVMTKSRFCSTSIGRGRDFVQCTHPRLYEYGQCWCQDWYMLFSERVGQVCSLVRIFATKKNLCFQESLTSKSSPHTSKT